ncbi:MAG: tetratricopeptide repeat protein [Woeseiaceae bacterium]|nr:tetratricopeptide repeat protein [Woeseiaceae bacterium]
MTEEKDEKTEVYRFGDCVLDAARRELTRDGKPVTTQPKAFELLLFLVRNRRRAVDKDELQDALWPRSIVTETALTRCVMKARRAVGDDAEQQAVIKTVHGHGYRFIAELEQDAPAEGSTAGGQPGQSIRRRSKAPLVAAAAALVVAAFAGWWFFTPHAISGEHRLAVLPVENATGDEELDWVRTGMMSLMNRMFEAKGVNVVSERSIIDLAADKPLDELVSKNSEFAMALQKTTSNTHTLAATITFEQGLYRLNYSIAGGDMRTQRRTIVGKEPARLVKDAVDTIASLVETGPPPDEHMRIISEDDFLNEAYARAMSLEFEGSYEDAKQLFAVIVEQDPELFWPRYEYALCVRNLRDWETAERLLVELVDEQRADGNGELEAISTNGLGILYMNQRRNEEALQAFDTVIRLATAADKPMYVVTANINLGLLNRNVGDIEAAAEHMEKAHAVLQGMDLNTYPGTFHNNYAGILMRTGNLDAAEQHAHAAIESFELTGRRLFAAYAKSRLSSIYRSLGRYDEARDLTQESLAVRREFNDLNGIASSLLGMAQLSVQLGDLTRARQYAEQVRDVGVEMDDQDIIALAIAQRARVERLTGDPRAAAASYAEAEAIQRSINNTLAVNSARVGIARSWIDMDDFDGAEGIGQEILQAARDTNQEGYESRALMLLGEIDLGRTAWRDAVAHFDEALAIAERIGDRAVAFALRANLAEAWLELNDTAAARPYLDAAILERPEHTEVYRLQARMAWEEQDPASAAEFMTLARNGAGEAWSNDDAAELERYRAAIIATP